MFSDNAFVWILSVGSTIIFLMLIIIWSEMSGKQIDKNNERMIDPFKLIQKLKEKKDGTK